MGAQVGGSRGKTQKKEGVTMDLRKLAQRVKGILLKPRAEWPVIAGEPASVASLYKGYILELAAIPAICGLIVAAGDMPMARAFVVALVSYVVSLAMVFLTALVIEALASRFGGEKSRVQALKAAAYAFTASWVAGIGVLIPALSGVIALVGLVYAIYLLYLGLPETMKSPAARAGGYTASTVVAVIAIGVIVGLVTGGIFGSASWMSGRSTSASAPSRDSHAGHVGRFLSSVLGSADTEALAPQRLERFAPETLAGMPRTSLEAERKGGGGFQVSAATATYAAPDGRELKLEIVDSGSVSGFMAMVEWADVPEKRRHADGYEETVRENDRLVHREWKDATDSGKYAVVLGQRFFVALNGEKLTMQDLESAMKSVDLDGLEALRSEGVKKD
jgi:hypothetical protein